MTQQNPFNMPGQKPAPKKPIDEFEIMRQRLKRRGATTGQEQQRDLSRQFAALGNAPSGAALKIRQQAATANQRTTNEALQDVNMMQAQTQRAERESQAQRQLQRDLQAQQIGAQQNLQTQQLEFQGQEGAATRDAQRGIAELSARTDLEKAELAGANAVELENIRSESNLRLQGLVEKGMDSRLAQQVASNRELFDLEMEYNKEGRSLEEELARQGLDMQERELAMNKTVTALNSVDLLFSMGFNNADVAEMLEALELPFQDKLLPFLEERNARFGGRR